MYINNFSHSAGCHRKHRMCSKKSIPGASGIASPPWKSSVADACPTAAITRFSPIRTWVGSKSFTHVNKNTLGWLTMEKLPSMEQPKYHWPKAGWSSSKWNIWLFLRNQTSEGTLWINILEKAQCKNILIECVDRKLKNTYGALV